MAREDPHFRLRIPETLKARIEAAANAGHRSINAEILKRLQDTLDYDEHLSRHAEAPEPSEGDYGLSYGDHLRSHPTPGVSIMSTLGTILDEVRALRGMSIAEIHHLDDGRRQVELLPANGDDDDVVSPDPETFPKPGDDGYDEALLDKVRSIASRYGYGLVRREAAEGERWDWSKIETPPPAVKKAGQSKTPAKKKA